MRSKLSRLALATAAGLVCLFVNDNWSSTKQSTLITQADARIGHPLTPGSIAGVNRRVDRRAYRRGYYGGGYGYYRPGLGLAAGAALGTAAAYNGYVGSGYYGNGGYAAYTTAAYDTSGGDAYILHGNYISEADAVAYCAQRFRSYDPESRTFLAHSGQRVSCPQ